MKIIRIDVKNKSISHDLITKNSKYFLLGARGLTSQIVFDEVNPTCDPLGPKNKLIIANGTIISKNADKMTAADGANFLKVMKTTIPINKKANKIA